MPPRFMFRLFPLAARGSRWLDQRFTRGGRLLLGVLVSGAILGIDISQTLAYQLAALAFSLLATSFVLTLYQLTSPAIVKDMIRYIAPAITKT